MRTALVLGALMMFGTVACDGDKKADAKAPAKADDAKAKADDAKAKPDDVDIAVGKDGKAQPLGVPGM